MSIGSASDRQKKLIIILVLIMSVLAVYWQVQNFEFINYDDQQYVTDNYSIQQGISLKSITDTFTDIHTSHWHPLTMLSHMVDWELFGKNARGHHWTSVIIHIFNTILLFLLFKTMTRALWRSAFIAALFAIHPINVESVAWIAERKNVLSTFFWILTMLCYVWYVKSPGWKRYLPILICFILGLMSKAMLVTLPFVLLLMDYWPLGRTIIRAQEDPSMISISVKKTKISFLILEKIPLFLSSIISIAVTLHAMRSVGAVVSLETLPLAKRVANALVSYILYVQKLLCPVDLAVFYPHWAIPLWQVIAAAVFLIATTVLACKYFRKYPYLIVGWLWYMGTLFPVIGLAQVGRQSMADRYAYVPFIGLFLIIAWIVPQIFSKLHYSKRYVSLVFLFIIMILTITTYIRIGKWENTTTLFEDALRVNPTNYLAYNILGLEEGGQGNHEKALYYYNMSIKFNPKFDSAYNNAGNEFLMLGKYREAYNCYQKAILTNNKSSIAYHNLGVLFALNDRADEAVIYFNKSLAITPDYINGYISMGNTLLKMGNIKDAILYFEKAINLNPKDIAAQKGLRDCLDMQKKN